MLNLRSFERATNALGFFDHHIPRTVARVTAMTVSNRLLSTAEAASLGSLDQYFDHAEVVVTDPASLLHDVEELVARTPDLHERFARPRSVSDGPSPSTRVCPGAPARALL